MDILPEPNNSNDANQTDQGAGVSDTATTTPPLRANAATAISRVGYEDQYAIGQRIVMQVVGIARLKYSIPSHRRFIWNQDNNNNDNAVGEYHHEDSRESFKGGKSIRFADAGSKCWNDDTPYRLQLSDGECMIAGGFGYEDSSRTRGEGFAGPDGEHSSSDVHQLVQTGQLKEGTVISFQPFNYVAGGRGLVGIRSMKVEGWTEVIGTPRPCHDGVPAFSPSVEHHCTVSFDAIHAEQYRPIDWGTALLAKMIQDRCGYCALTGSAALAEYLDTLPGCPHCYEQCYGSAIAKLCINGDFSNDVDLFVPQYPDAVATFYETHGTKQAARGMEFTSSFLEKEILSRLFARSGIRHTQLVVTPIDRVDLGDMHPYLNVDAVPSNEYSIGWMKVFVGLKQKIEFNLVSASGQLLSPKPIQILVVNAFPDSPSQTWGDKIIQGFDADVIMSLAHVGIECENRVESIAFSEGTLENLKKGRFEYIIRPCHSFPEVMKRITKYAERGFRLHKLSFDDKVSQEWRDDVLLQFHVLYATCWVKEQFDMLGIETNDDSIGDISDEHILPFLECRSKEDVEAEKRGMLRRNILAELDRNDWYDPGHKKIDKRRLLAMWRSIDEADESVSMDNFWLGIGEVSVEDENDGEEEDENTDDEDVV